MDDVPHPRAVHIDDTVVIPAHLWLEAPFDMSLKVINSTTEVLNAVKGLVPLQGFIYVASNDST